MLLKDRIRKEQPRCILCAGSRPTETIEHMPSRILFDGKQRPKGLEFGACTICNAATRRDEVVVALVSRIYPNPTSSTGKAEIRKIMRSAERNNPGLLQEMYADQLQTLSKYQDHLYKLPTWNFLSLDGPIAAAAMERFIAKLGFALHYAATNRIVPSEGGVVVSVYSNLESFIGRLPELLPHLGPGQTLRAGRQEVSKQFRYSSIASEDGSLSGHVAVFRESFAAQMVVLENVAEHPVAPLCRLYQPGFLSRPVIGQARA